MRILFLAPQPFFEERGTPIAIRLVVEALAEAGHAIDLLTYPFGQDVGIPRVAHHRSRPAPAVKRVPPGPSWQKLLSDTTFLSDALRLARANRYDLVHGVEEGAFIANLIKRRFGVPFVFDMDSLMSAQIVEKNALLWPAAKVFEAMERRAVRSAAGVLAVCPALVDAAKSYDANANVALLPDVPNTGMDDGPLPESLTGARGVRFLYVGNLERYQGVDLMLEAFELAARERPEATLVVVGGALSQIETYRAKCAPLSAAGRVVFTGPIPLRQLGHVLAHGDVLVSPRIKGNNTPMKVYSYLQSGKPVLATRLPTHTQVLHDEVAKLVAPEPRAMADGMAALLDDPALRASLGERGRAYVEREYSHASFKRRLLEFYAALPLASAKPQAAAVGT